jgi:hypothetical protein
MTAKPEIYSYQAETFFPLQGLQLSNIQIHPPAQNTSTFTPQYSTRLPILPISYKDSLLTMPKLGILTPFLRVHAWDGTIGRLDLELDSESLYASKLQEFQTMCIQYLQSHPEISQSKEDIPIRFQPFISFPILTVFLSCSDTSTLKTHIYDPVKDSWEQIQSNFEFQKGKEIRLTLRCQGLLCIPIQGGGVRFRLQHTVPAIYMRLGS